MPSILTNHLRGNANRGSRRRIAILMRLPSTLSGSLGDLAILYKLATIFAALFDIDKADGNHRSCTNGKKEREPHPVVLGAVDDCLNDVWTDN